MASGTLASTAEQVDGDHDRLLVLVLNAHAERQSDHCAGHSGQRSEQRDLEHRGIQHQQSKQRQRPHADGAARCTDQVGAPQPVEVLPKRAPLYQPNLQRFEGAQRSDSSDQPLTGRTSKPRLETRTQDQRRGRVCTEPPTGAHTRVELKKDPSAPTRALVSRTADQGLVIVRSQMTSSRVPRRRQGAPPIRHSGVTAAGLSPASASR